MDVDTRARDSTAGPFPLPGDQADVAGFARSLRAVKVWAGDPSLETLHRRTGVATSTLSDAFNPQRKRLPALDLVLAIVRACGADPSETAEWGRAWRTLGARIDNATTSVPPRSTDPLTWVPRELPRDVAGFIGRTDTLTMLAGTASQAQATVITGMAGVGKTALTVHWAHQIADRYPDGQLYLDLRGHSGDPAMTSTEALSLLLQSLGVAAERIPVDVHLQTGLYRSVLSGRRVLVVLDNALDVAQVRPMLPSGPHCHALITSRDALTGLVVREGAAHLTLDTLTTTESADLLATHLGPGRTAAEPDATAQLAGLCAHLPLALRISAANLSARPSQTIAGTVRELSSSDRLGRLQVVGDPGSAVAAAFDVSYRSLSEQVQQLFRRLGVVPGPDVDRETTAILLDRDPSDPVPELDELVTAHLVFESGSNRYRMHDLLSLYARRQAAAEPEAVREATLHRLMSWYLLNTDAAARIITLADALEDRSALQLTGEPRDFVGPDDARAWLDAEMPNLAAAVTHAADHGPAPFAWHLSNSLHAYLYTAALGTQHLAVASTALRAAQASGDFNAQGLCRMSLAVEAGRVGDLKTALTEIEAALECFTLGRHESARTLAVGALADIWLRLGDLGRALQYSQEGLEFQYPTTFARSVALSNLAIVQKIRGNHAEALRVHSENLTYAEQTGAVRLAGMAKLFLAMALLDGGDPASAEPLFLAANSAAVEFGRDLDAFDALSGLVLCCVRTGRTDEALTWLAPLRDLVDRGVCSYSGDDWGHAAILEALLAAGLLDDALTVGETALEEYDRAGHRLTAMRVRVRLGRVQAARGEGEAARHHWEAALAYVIEQSLPGQSVIEGLLADLPR